MLLRILTPVLRNAAAKQSLGYGLRSVPRLSALCSYTTTSSEETVKISAAERNARLHTSSEIVYFHGVMERLDRYQGTVFSKEMIRAELCDPGNFDIEAVNAQDWNALPDEELVEVFRKVTSYAVSRNMTMSTSCFTPVCDAVRERLGALSSAQLIVVGKLFSLWPAIPAKHSEDACFKLFANDLDSACCDAYSEDKRNFSLVLQLSELWYWSNMGRFSNYLRFTLYSSLLKAKEPQHILQFLFYLNVMRNLPPSFKVFSMQKTLLYVNPDCSLDELAFAALGFYRTKKIFQHSSIVPILLKRMREEASTIHEITLSALCKSTIDNVVAEDSKVDILETQKIVAQRAQELSFTSLKRLLFLGSDNNALNKEFAHVVYDRLWVELGGLKAEDLCHFLHVFSTCSLDTKVLAEKVIESIRGEMQPKYYTCLILQLMTCGVWPLDLVGNLLNRVHSDNMKDFHVSTLCIDILMEVFYPDRGDLRLSTKYRQIMYETLFNEIKLNSFIASEIREWFDLLKSAVGNKDGFVIQTSIIPATPMDVVLCVDKTGSLVSVPEQLLQYEPWQIKKIPECVQSAGGKLIAIIFDRSFPRKFRSSKNLNVLWHQREKQMTLEKLGFQVHVIPLNDWVGKDKTMFLEDFMQLLRIKNPSC